MTSNRGRSLPIALSLLGLVVGMGASAPAARAHEVPEKTPRPLLAAIVGGSIFADEEMRRMYGTLPAVGLRIHLADGPSVQYVLGVRYCARRGNGFYDDPVFESDDAKLTLMPVELGLRTNLMRRHRHAFYLGVAGEYVRVWEAIQGADGSDPSVSETFRSWALGVRLLGGPEFDLGGGGWLVGSEFSLGRSFTAEAPDHHGWTAELTGPAVLGYVARRL